MILVQVMSKEGSYLNQSLFQFKTGFGSGSVVHEYYDLEHKESGMNEDNIVLSI